MLLGSMLGALSGVDGADGYGLFIASRVVVSPLSTLLKQGKQFRF